MKIKTKPFGEIEISEERIIHIEEGIIGFKETKDYVLVNAGEGSPFMWLQAVDRPDLAFIVIPPGAFRPGYKLEVTGTDLASIDLKDLKDAVILAIVVVPDDPSKMTANLQAPVVINSKSWQGKQMISTNPNYTIRHYILEEMQQILAKGKGPQRENEE